MISRRGLVGSGLILAATGLMPPRAFALDDPDVIVNDIALEDDRVWISAMIDGKGPWLLIIDTGASQSFIDNDFARSIGLETWRGRPMRGVGGNLADYSWFRAKQVVVGNGTSLSDVLFAGIGKRPSKDAVGAFGAGLFTAYDSDLDFVKGKWRVYPKGRANFDGLEKLPSRMFSSGPVQRIELEVTIDGFAARCMVDTGAPNISLGGRAAAESGLWDSGRPYAPTLHYGLGDGPGTRARTMRAKRIKVGRFVFENMLVILNRPGSKSMEQDGLVGLSLLAMLDLSTDVSEGSLWARPNGLRAPRAQYALSGIWLDEVKGRVVVGEVGIGSPAAAAGLQVGDLLLGGDIKAMLRLVNGPAGKQVALRIERSGAQQDIRYTLADYL